MDVVVVMVAAMADGHDGANERRGDGDLNASRMASRTQNSLEKQETLRRPVFRLGTVGSRIKDAEGW